MNRPKKSRAGLITKRLIAVSSVATFFALTISISNFAGLTTAQSIPAALVVQRAKSTEQNSLPNAVQDSQPTISAPTDTTSAANVTSTTLSNSYKTLAQADLKATNQNSSQELISPQNTSAPTTTTTQPERRDDNQFDEEEHEDEEDHEDD